ncbi:GerMN domain-containing protein [Sporosarcina luteola]|uniref:GerMN domain-containing protein n=1 Tax=Sporosarcina luteola TaxID=582850 RepID=UPI00203CB040|nr:GerMN domain-containing protein [Sporosarcina luteola]MCM3712356.1 GerMN domain-containing protein [Sporosarcina luteola]
MKKTENLTQEAKQLLRPIKDRPDIAPSQEFVNELHTKLRMDGKRRKTRVKLVPLLAAAAIIVILPLLILTSQSEKEETHAYTIEESSNIELVDTIKYGYGEGEIGFSTQGMNPVSSFDMRHGTLYLLDEEKSQVVIKSGGTTRSFSVQNDQNIIGDLNDILVTQDEEIYILNAVEKVVHQYRSDGELTKTYDLSQLDLFFPDSLVEIENNEIIVSQNQEKFVDLKTVSLIEDQELPFQIKQVNRKERIVVLNDESERTELALFSDFTLAYLALQDVKEEQIIYMQTVSLPVMTPVSETHVFGLDKKGNKIGGVRIPEENFIEKPLRVENYIATDQNEIYLLIPENEHVALYKVTLGKDYESFIEEQMEEVNIGFDTEMFGRPFPELEEEIRKLFKNGTIQYGNEESLNGVAIDENGTVVIDFKDFMAGSPASAEAQSLFGALHSATFKKFPEIQQIYFQFDGSFSAWAHWLESTEEPWKRQNSN